MTQSENSPEQDQDPTSQEVADSHVRHAPDSSGNAPYPLASRLHRLAAAILDDSLALLTLLPVFGYYDILEYAERNAQIPFGLIININIFAFVLFLLVHGYLLYNYGQTLGKRVMGIAIATMDFQVPSFNRLIALRYVPFRIAGVIPGLNLILIVNVLFIFRPDRRCLHDLLAGTQVIYVGTGGGRDQPG